MGISNISIMDRYRYLEIAVTCVKNANYLNCFQDKTSIQLFNEITFLQYIILILKTTFGDNIFMNVAKRIEKS